METRRIEIRKQIIEKKQLARLILVAVQNTGVRSLLRLT